MESQITGSAFWISFRPFWQNDNGFFQQPNHGTYSNPGTQVACTVEQGFWHCFTDKLNQSLVSSVAQAIILWDGRENFSHDDGTIIYPHYFGVFYIILSFLSSNKINQIYHLYFFSSSSSKNINSVSSQCLRYDWTLFFAGHCSFRRTLHSVMYMYM